MPSVLSAFDLRWSIDPEILPFALHPSTGDFDVRVAWASRTECQLAGGPSTVIWVGATAGQITLERGDAGDHLFVSDGARFHVSAALDEIACTAEVRADHGWRRVLFDTVMFCTALLRGRRMLHASAVSIDGRIVAFPAATGGGKSSLAWALMHAGASLVSDDVVTLGIDGPVVVCSPGPPLMNLPEGVPLDGMAVEVAAFPSQHERWVRVQRAARETGPVAAIVLLDRRPGQATRIAQLAPSPLLLLGASIHLDMSPRGGADRFALMCDIAERVPMYRLTADPGISPLKLANGMAARLRTDGVLGPSGSVLGDRSPSAAGLNAPSE